MEDANAYLGLPSPTSPLQYVYGDGEQYLDTMSSFDSQSGSNSPVSGTRKILRARQELKTI
jgi:hypothetical protein